MDRRDFMAGFGVYSFAVFADRLPAATTPASPDQIRKDLERLSPRPGVRRSVPPGETMTVTDLQTDFLVAGGGLAGVCAAIAAARHGAKVILVQDRSRLGGNSSSEVKMHVCGSHAVPGWRETGLVEEFRIEDAVRNPQRSFEMWDLMLYDKVISEPNITLLLDTFVYAAKKDKDRITEVLARSDKTERVYRIAAKMFCDSTGDCRLGLEAGAEMRTGREARGEFNESLAPEEAVDETLGSSIMFTSRRYPKPMPFTPPSWARKITKEHVRHRRITEWDYGYWWIEWGGDRDLIGDNERIRFELLSIATGLWDYIKNSGEFPDTECWALDWLGMIPAKRGSRRLVGDHILTQDDVTSRDFEDAVAIGGWPLDDHPARGFDRPEIAPNTAVATPPFNIPLRCLYCRNIPHLFMAGRNISCSHVAFTSTRVMGTCAAEGQAVGTAAAMCIHDGIAPGEIVRDRHSLQSLQQTLLRDDQTIKGRVNKDSKDLARLATVTASSQEAGAEAAKIIDGCLRDLYEKKERTEIHQWATRMGESGAWIELTWEKPRRIAEIQITFDTGLRRTLMLSGDGSLSEKMIRAPQPETVRDYTVSYRPAGAGDSTELVSVKGNYCRLVRHQFTPVEAQSVRIHLTATNGDEFARIFEVRCY